MKPTPSTTTKTIEEILRQVWNDGRNTNPYPWSNDLISIANAKAAINNLINQRVIEELERLKQEMQMHTVPEGKHLITRSYLNNSIDFMVESLKGGSNADQ